MKRTITGACLLLAGVAIGWWLRDVAPEASPPHSLVPVSSSDTQAGPSSRTKLPATPDTTDIDSLPVLESTKQPGVAHFGQLLDQTEFQQAVAYYESALKIDDSYQPLLKPRLEGYLSARLHQCADGAFVDLVDLWLDAYYADIPVLLLLAENQRLCSSPEEAARTLQIAHTYAIRPGPRESVSAAVTRLITATDKSLSQQQSWIELLGFYEFLQTIDLATNASQLRRAALYQLIGESPRSQALLLELKESDDRLDSEWTAALDLQWSNNAQQSSTDDPPMHAIPLTRQGDHFVVAMSINDVSQVNLMIDTGASVTTLSKAGFAQIDSAGLRYRGSRLFNTPNGMTQGDVYQTASITLGSTRLNALEIAVLDYESSAGVDGLLGMNVLRNYHFEIDQDTNVLHLRPRR
jgi:clan AA aspartic protease (TIGR02281 family)